MTGPSLKVRGGPQGCSVIPRLVFTIFTLAGLFFLYLVGREVIHKLEPLSWNEISCTIIESAVTETDSNSFTVAVRYRYTVNGAPQVGTVYKRGHEAFDSMAEAQRAEYLYAPGSEHTCYLSPDAQEVVLSRASPLYAALLLIPLVFIAVGVGGLFMMRRSTATVTGTPLSDKGKRSLPRLFLVLLFGAFLLAGGSFGYFFFLKPLLNSWSAKTWNTVSCTVEASEVRTHSGDDGDTYSVYVRYNYEVNGRRLRSDRYDFFEGSTSGYESKREIVDGLPPGSTVPCYVNPADPTDVVISRELGATMFFVIIPLTFFIIGLAGVIFALRSGRKPEPGYVSGPTGGRSSRFASSPSGPVILKPTAGPLARLIAVILVAAFWNGITGFFVWHVAEGWLAGNPDYLLTAFMTPFVLVGLALIFGIGYTFLTLFNPRVELTVSSRTPALGSQLSVSWRIIGKGEKISKLRIYIEGREESTYRRGTSTYTDREVFREIEVYTVQGVAAGKGGSTSVRIPEDTMHSLDGSSNSIVWVLKVHGEIANWPDLAEDFDIEFTAPERSASRW